PAARFGAVPRAVTVIWVESLPGAHVPEYTPPAESVSFITNAGSPFEKVATTWPLTTGSPQSSASRIASVEGQPAGAAKLFTSPVCVSASLTGVQPATALVFADELPTVAGCTTTVTFVE